ncbi:MAG: YfhO family protein [Rhodospirillales bacterium]|nr:YfhO family protein [Rhodospirillales bacterium]
MDENISLHFLTRIPEKKIQIKSYFLFDHLQKIADGCQRHPAILFLVISLILVLDHFILGPFSALKWLDIADSHFVRYLMMSKSMETYGPQYWYPYQAGGVDLLANGYRNLDPFLFFFKVLPHWLVIPVLRFIQLFIAGWFTFLICRDYLKLSTGAALMGGLFFQFHQLNLMEHYIGFGAFPLLIWATERLYPRRGWLPWIGMAGIGVAYGLASTVHLAILFTLPGLFAWMWLVRGKALRRIFPLIVVLGAFSLLPQIEMLWAMAENALFSQRIQWDYSLPYFQYSGGKLLFQLFKLLFLIFLAFIGVGFALREGSYRPLILILLTALAFSMIILDDFLSQFLGAYFTPLRGFHFFRYAHLAIFYVSVAAAVGIWHLSKRASHTSVAMTVFILAILSAVPVPGLKIAGHIHDWVKWGSYVANMESPDIKAIARESKTTSEPFRVAVVEENGLYAASVNLYGLETIGGVLAMYHHRFKNFWGLVIDPLLSRNEIVRGNFLNYGSSLTIPTNDNHSLRLVVRDYFRTNLLSLANVRYVLSTVPLDSPDLKLVNDIKSERLWQELSKKERTLRHVSENFIGRRVMVYLNKTILPRWFLSGITFYENEEDLNKSLIENNALAFHRTALIEKKNSDKFIDIDGEVPGGMITPGLYSPDTIRLNVTSKAAAALVLTNTFSPYWRAFVNGKESPIVPAYGTFMAIFIPTGQHLIEFKYDPPYRFF